MTHLLRYAHPLKLNLFSVFFNVFWVFVWKELEQYFFPDFADKDKTFKFNSAAKELLLKGKAQYGRPPCKDSPFCKLWLVLLKTK